MNKKLWYSLIAIGSVCFGGVAVLFYFQNPLNTISLGVLSFSPLILFFILLFIGVFCISSALLKNFRRGSFAALVITSFFLMRLFGFRSLVHSILLLIIVILIEVIFFHPTKKIPIE